MKIMAASQNIRGQERAVLQSTGDADDFSDGKLPSTMQLVTDNKKLAGSLVVGKLVSVEVTILSLLLLLTVGCSSIEKAYVPEPVYHPSIPVATNVMTGEVTMTTPAWTTNYVKNPAIDQGISTLETVGSLTGIPFAGTIGAVLALLYGAGVTIINRQNKNKAATAISTLVDNIEAARDIIKTLPNGKEIDAKYVEKIADSQTVAGVRADIHKILT